MKERLHITISGAVQGVGFRPFVYRLAHDFSVHGWVNNCPQGVSIDAEALPEKLTLFWEHLQHHLPPHAEIHHIKKQSLPLAGYTCFEIRQSVQQGNPTAVILPDFAICPDCLQELFDSSNRRHLYPFINCTHCGPRFSIVTALPYDRPNTTMHNFFMCEACQKEYDDPLDRRFHAQPIACPVCGPKLALWDSHGATLAEKHEALLAAADAIKRGHIIALKGLGGFQLLADARSNQAVQLLRERKRRRSKPFAVMYPNIEQLLSDCLISYDEIELLSSAAAPIVLVQHKNNSQISSEVAPDNPYLGAMLPYTPLHHLLIHQLNFPIVATSGNLSGEPICIDEYDAVERLNGIADLFLVHNRPIARQVDDSVVRIAAGGPIVLRRARGYAPMSIEYETKNSPILAVGAHQKSTVAIYDGQQIVLSQHIGDLDTVEANTVFNHVVQDMQHLYKFSPDAIISDLHPDYRSTHYAEKAGLPHLRVQHHAAHVLSCMAEHKLNAPILGIAWDGTGYGEDGTIWGGEFLQVDPLSIKRVACLQPFYLPGGETAVREPRRSALGLLYTLFGDSLPLNLACIKAFTPYEFRLLMGALHKNVNTPVTSSAGRLFDAVASLLNLKQITDFEGEAAMALEFQAMRVDTEVDAHYPFELTGENRSSLTPLIIGLKPFVDAMLDDFLSEVNTATIAMKFHNTLTEIILKIAQVVGIEQVALTGGCFQNKLLLENTITRLKDAGFQPYWNQKIPLNDGGIAFGQIMAALKGYTHVFGSSRKDLEY